MKLREKNLGGGQNAGIVQRDSALDMMKGWLTVLMVLSHLTYVIPFDGIDKINSYVNLTTFSGFMFCFGYVCRSAYIESKRQNVDKRLIRGAFKSLLAFYICGIGFYMRGTALDWGKVLFLQVIPTLTEFLVSFSLMYIMILIFRKQLKELSWKSCILTVIASLIITAVFPFEMISSPVMGSIVGTTAYCSFPLLAYLSYFLIGSLLAKYQITWNSWLFITVCISTGIFFVFCKVNGRLPGRFPPTVLWVLGGSLFIYLYYCFFKLMSQKGKEVTPLIFIGKHTLVFLVVSNLLIFSVWNHLVAERIWETISMNRWGCRYMIYIIITFVLSWGVIRINEKRKQSALVMK
ncbi:MAG: hypothetical protein NC416_10705 [Eubacterium sp.]|nr:hypothetical protein [Eubacterium sp.]